MMVGVTVRKRLGNCRSKPRNIHVAVRETSGLMPDETSRHLPSSNLAITVNQPRTFSFIVLAAVEQIIGCVHAGCRESYQQYPGNVLDGTKDVPQARWESGANPVSMVYHRSSRQEVLWFANGNLEKINHHVSGVIPARPPCPVYGSPAPVKVVRKMSLALRAGGSVCGSTCDSARRAKDVAG